MTAPRLVLASGSRYRAALLQRLGFAFETASPGIDETPRAGESPRDLATRLAADKARCVAAGLGDALVIGSDQVADLDGRPVGKPGDMATARAQLRAASGRTLAFHTGLCLLDGRDAREYHALDTTRVHFRPLDAAEIDRYLERERPLDCAGSFKCEGLGISLFARIENDDPTALIGLPLIALARLLRGCGIDVP